MSFASWKPLCIAFSPSSSKWVLLVALAAAPLAACAVDDALDAPVASEDAIKRANVVAHDEKALLGTWRAVGVAADAPEVLQRLSLHPGDGKKVNGQGPFFHAELVFRDACGTPPVPGCDPRETSEVESRWEIRLDKKGKPLLTLFDEDDGFVGHYAYDLRGDDLHLRKLTSKNEPKVEFDMMRAPK